MYYRQVYIAAVNIMTAESVVPLNHNVCLFGSWV